VKIDYSRLPKEWSCIVIDGDPGAGKTTLAGEMAKHFDARVISFDGYLPDVLGDERSYVDKLNYEKLINDVSTNGPKIICEGVLAIKVLQKIKRQHDYHIFMKRIRDSMGWELGLYLNVRSELPRLGLWQEIVLYYREYKPFEICDYLIP
jgi:hypothetical protein